MTGAGSRALDLLPHRPPFRFIDSVDTLEPGHSATARYLVTGEEPGLSGHFPGNPIFPGVLQVEALAQVGALAVLADPRHTGRLPLFGGMENVRFRRVVRPGDELVLSVTLERLGGRGGWGRARASVAPAVDAGLPPDGATVACEGRLLFAFAPLA
ncbi:MAG: 3-hydroxyacyl-ACP dehydratase FabZ [Acidimicrobiales bacterium]